MFGVNYDPTTHTYDDRENLDMVTYVPPLSDAEPLSPNSNNVFYTGNESTRTNNSTLVVKPIDGRLSAAFVNGQQLQSIARPDDKHSVPSQQTMYNHSTSRALPQLPKSSVVGNGQQLVVCGGRDTETSCISWRHGQDGWTQYARLR